MCSLLAQISGGVYGFISNQFEPAVDHRRCGTYFGTLVLSKLHALFPGDDQIKELYEAQILLLKEMVRTYATYLRECSAGGVSPTFMSDYRVRIQVLAEALEEDPRARTEEIDTISAVLNVEACIRREFAGLIRRYVKEGLTEQIKAELLLLGRNLFVFPYAFDLHLTLDEAWKAIRYVLGIFGGNEKQLYEIFSVLDQGSRHRMLWKTQGLLNPDFQARRLDNFYRNEIVLNGTNYKIVEVLGKSDPQGRGFLTCVVKSPTEEKKVIRFGAHEVSAALTLSAETSILYENVRRQEKDACEAEYKHSPPLEDPQHEWIFPTLLPDEIIQGAWVGPWIQTLFFADWGKSPLTPEQLAQLEKSSEVFLAAFQHGKIPQTLEEFEKIGVKFVDGRYVFRQTKPLLLRDFTMGWAEVAMCLMAGQSFSVFNVLRQKLFSDSDVRWDLKDEMEPLIKSLHETGDVPELKPDASSRYIDQTNTIATIRSNLMNEGLKNLSEEESEVYRKETFQLIGQIIGVWMRQTHVVQISEWDRLQSDVRHLLRALKDREYALPEDLLSMYQTLESMRAEKKKEKDQAARWAQEIASTVFGYLLL